MTPITFNKSDNSSQTVNVSAKEGKVIQQTFIGEQEPTDPSVEVWINPNGDSVEIPTKTSDLNNDSGFIVSSENKITSIWVGTQTEYDAIQTKGTTTLYIISGE